MKLGQIFYLTPKNWKKFYGKKTKRKIWDALMQTDIMDYVDYRPLAGGLDHITKTKKQITFHDIGVSRGGRIIDNTFTVRKRRK